MADESQNETPLNADSSEKKTKSWLTKFQWKPGQSGNPGGRRKNPFTQMYSEIMDNPKVYEAVKEHTTKLLLQNKSFMATVLQQEKMAERLEGKVAERMELNVDLNVTLSERLKKAKERMRNKS